MAKRVNIQVRNTEEYNECIEEIYHVIEQYELTFVEAFGVLDCVKNELMRDHLEL